MATAASNTIEAELACTVDDGTRPVTRTAGIHEVLDDRRRERELRKVPVHDGRPGNNRFSLDAGGFVFADHATRVTDFYDAGQIFADG